MSNSISDLRISAKRALPKMFYDYIDSGSWSEQTYRANELDLQSIHLKQRVGIDVSSVSSDISTPLVSNLPIPVCISPTGLAGMNYPNGEILAAQASEKYGVKYTLSTMSICSIEDVAASTKLPFWFQLYVMRDRGFVKSLIERAKAAKCDALVLTLDLPLLGQRHKDLTNGLTCPPKINLSNIHTFISRPKWCFSMVFNSKLSFGNLIGHAPGVTDLSSLSSWISEQFDPSFTWDDVAWIRDCWDGKLILKGITDVRDAKTASALGVDAIVVSNHGGRQLDGAPSSISCLSNIVNALHDDNLDIIFDGGIRSGQDVFRSLALGATFTMIGRSYLYGLATSGSHGVLKVLKILESELKATMALCGCNSISDITLDCLYEFPVFATSL
jgi:L-lactate dehydrogenase (cytochrome)